MNVANALFEIARRLPGQPAVTSDAGTLTYAALYERSSRIAGSLAQELQPGDRVVLCLENSAEVFELLFACWIAGLCAVPTNSKLHSKEVDYIVQSSGARRLFTSPGLVQSLSPLEAQLPVICTGTDRYSKLLEGPQLAIRAAQPEDAAWIFYTSGTTGRPKGAALSHRSLLFMSHAYYADIDPLDERDTNLHLAPLSHGGGLYALPHLFKGSHQVILGGSFDAGQTFDAIAKYPNVSFFAAPTVLTRLLQSPSAKSARLQNLKTIIYGGGPMYVADLKRSLQLFGPRLYQLFGQGESPMTITGLDKRQHADAGHPRYEALLGSVGHPRTGVSVKVVDADDREVPFGEVGEVITRSDCVMLGYLGDAKATAETLRNGWLHTGDLGSMDPDGLVTLRDRSKDLIISGGSNIYPRELEEVLLRHPGVLEVSVVGRPHAEWGEEVVAFVVLRQQGQATQEELDQLCLANIARYKRPREYRFVESLPKNNYGKVLKTALRQGLLSVVAALAVMLGSACGGSSPVPCATCLAVGGSYVETAASTQVDCGDARVLYFNGGRGLTQLTQDGSVLSFSSGGTTMPGVLHSDGSASFGPIPAVAQPVGGVGEPTPGKLYLEGWFSGGAAGGTSASFAGTYVFIADPDGCELDARASWHH